MCPNLDKVTKPDVDPVCAGLHPGTWPLLLSHLTIDATEAVPAPAGSAAEGTHVSVQPMQTAGDVTAVPASVGAGGNAAAYGAPAALLPATWRSTQRPAPYGGHARRWRRRYDDSVLLLVRSTMFACYLSELVGPWQQSRCCHS
jgi:hypothetical protein